jgi:CDP-6-deoxy-D-xylo-4-hexulose-3-dehydrase
MGEEETREKIKGLITELFNIRTQQRFKPGRDYLWYGEAYFNEEEIDAMVQCVLDCWFGLGKKGQKFEEEFADFIGSKKAILTNSGSSASLLCVAALCSDKLAKLRPGDEVITPSVNFPTSLNPSIQHGLKPVIVDVKLGNYNIDETQIEDAISRRTKLIMLPHMLGNPNNMDVLMDIVDRHDLIFVEDNCDALDSKYRGRKTGTFGIMSTGSFYPAHHMTLGEGGIICVNSDDVLIERTLRSLRDWGRACYCNLDEEEPACKNRFGFKVNGIPCDHKYMYTTIGYNLRPLELQAAFGLVQLKRIPIFTEARKKNFTILYEGFKDYEEYFILPEATEWADPSWFAFPLTLKDTCPFCREDLTGFLEDAKIQTRLIFGGNLIHHPAYKNVQCRVIGDLKNANKIMKDSFFLGLGPKIDEEKMDYMLDVVRRFMGKYV